MEWWMWLAIGWAAATACLMTGWIGFHRLVRGDFDKGAK